MLEVRVEHLDLILPAAVPACASKQINIQCRKHMACHVRNIAVCMTQSERSFSTSELTANMICRSTCIPGLHLLVTISEEVDCAVFDPSLPVIVQLAVIELPFDSGTACWVIILHDHIYLTFKDVEVFISHR
jgi:hypothetical protein